MFESSVFAIAHDLFRILVPVLGSHVFIVVVTIIDFAVLHPCLFKCL